MKLVADENIDHSMIERLRSAGHEVFAVAEMAPGIADDEVLRQANTENAMLLTEDKDFGELAYRQRLVHRGVILLRLVGLGTESRSSILLEVLASRSGELAGTFTVLSPGGVRIRRPDSSGFEDS